MRKPTTRNKLNFPLRSQLLSKGKMYLKRDFSQVFSSSTTWVDYEKCIFMLAGLGLCLDVWTDAMLDPDGLGNKAQRMRL